MSPEQSPSAAVPTPVRVRRAVLSVSDKNGIVDFARGLAALGVELVSTGGTATALRDAGLAVRTVDDLTGFPEMLGGRVKTLNPRLHASLLAIRDKDEHIAEAIKQGVEFVDLVCVNLYPFERVVASRSNDRHAVLESIDVGGPTMIRAAAKNHAYVAVVTRPEAYDAVLDELRTGDGVLSSATRESLAAEAFATTARYDIAISRWFAERDDNFPPLLLRAFEKVTDLPYGENPHQRGAYYAQVGARSSVLSMVTQHHGRALTYNNLLDLNAVRALIRGLDDPACAIVKHNNPCGAALGVDIADAYRKAFAGDPVSAYGGVIALNRKVDLATAEQISRQFVEVLIAPGYEADALELITRKENIRVLEDGERRLPSPLEPDIRQVSGGLLVADGDNSLQSREDMRVMTAVRPTDEQWQDMLFAWYVSRHVRSNAIVAVRDRATIGIGAGQMSRVDSVRLTVEKSLQVGGLSGAALASDAFFPFADGPKIAIDAGIKAIIQPGGSVRDDEVIAAAEQAGVTMVMTGTRHFRH